MKKTSKSKVKPNKTNPAKADIAKAVVKSDGNLTSQQESFCQSVVSGQNQSAAYRQAYNTKGMKPETVNNEASKLAKHPKIAARIEVLLAPIIAKSQYNLKQAMEDAEYARVQAMLLGNPAAAVAAVTLKAKLNGLLVQDRKNELRPLEELTEAELDREIERSLREAGMSVVKH